MQQMKNKFILTQWLEFLFFCQSLAMRNGGFHLICTRLPHRTHRCHNIETGNSQQVMGVNQHPRSQDMSLRQRYQPHHVFIEWTCAAVIKKNKFRFEPKCGSQMFGVVGNSKLYGLTTILEKQKRWCFRQIWDGMWEVAGGSRLVPVSRATITQIFWILIISWQKVGTIQMFCVSSLINAGCFPITATKGTNELG